MASLIVLETGIFTIKRHNIFKVILCKNKGVESMEYVKIGRIQPLGNGKFNCYDNKETRKINNGDMNDIKKVLNLL